MIANERQYRITRAQLKRLESGVAGHDARERSEDVDPRVHQAMRDAMLSEVEELQGQLRRYEELRDGKVSGCGERRRG